MDIYVSFKTFNETETETAYELTYNKETYMIFVKHDGKYHSRLWECEKEIPKELIWFVDSTIRRELRK